MDTQKTEASSEGKPVSISQRLGQLQFHWSGKFRVLQFADIQDGPKVSADTIRLLEAACDAARPDLVIFSGNQIAGYHDAFADTFQRRRWSEKPQETTATSMLREQTKALVRKQISQYIAPLNSRGIPWAVTYGNHDFQCGLSNAELDSIYREFEGCLNPVADADTAANPRLERVAALENQHAYACQPGTFALPVMDSEGKRAVLVVVLVDSGDYAREGGYGAPSESALSFIRQAPSMVGKPCMLFQHMPIPQYYQVLKTVPPQTDGAIQGYREFENHYYVLDPARTQPGSYLGEGVSCPDCDSGEFAAIVGAAVGASADSVFDGMTAGTSAHGTTVDASAVSSVDSVTAGAANTVYAAGVAENTQGVRGSALQSREHSRGMDDSRGTDDSRGADNLRSVDNSRRADNLREAVNRGYFALATGHDHRNGFVGSLDGLLLIATPTCGFGSYGPALHKRAARLFEFDIRHPYNPRTQLLEFGPLVGKPKQGRAYAYGMASVEEEDKGVDLLHKPSVKDWLKKTGEKLNKSLGLSEK